jgi:DedD protein
VLVLVVPAILDGNPDSGVTITHPTVEESLDLRTHTIRLDGAERDPPVPTPRQVAPIPESAVQPAPSADSPAASSGSQALEPVPAREPVRPLAQEALAGSGDWFVQLGSFSRRDNADRLAAELQRKGFSASIQGGGGSSGTLFRVLAGPGADRAAAEALAGRLAAAGFTGGRVGRQ